MRAAIYSLLIVSIAGCLTSGIRVYYPVINSSANSRDFQKYQKIAVLSITHAPGAPESGKIVRDMIKQELGKSGFTLVLGSELSAVDAEFECIMDEKQALTFSKKTGAGAVVLGAVKAYRSETVLDDSSFNDSNFIAVSSGRSFPPARRKWKESYVEIELKILDVDDGMPIYSAAGKFDQEVKGRPEELAAAIVSDIIKTWITGPGITGFDFSKTSGGLSIKKVAANSPAAKAGLKTSDIIYKVNEKSLADMPLLAIYNLIYCIPGDKIRYAVLRGGKNLEIEITAQ